MKTKLNEKIIGLAGKSRLLDVLVVSTLLYGAAVKMKADTLTTIVKGKVIK